MSFHNPSYIVLWLLLHYSMIFLWTRHFRFNGRSKYRSIIFYEFILPVSGVILYYMSMKLSKIFRLNFKFNQSVVGQKNAENEWWAIIEFQSQRWCWWLVSEIFRIKYVIKNTKRTRVSRLGEQSDWAIYWTLGNFLKPLTTINLSKSPTFLSIFCKGVKIYHFSSEIIFRQLL